MFRQERVVVNGLLLMGYSFADAIILGPLMFSLCINKILTGVKINLYNIVFADDGFGYHEIRSNDIVIAQNDTDDKDAQPQNRLTRKHTKLINDKYFRW